MTIATQSTEPGLILALSKGRIFEDTLPLLEAADRCFSSSNAEAVLQLPRHFKKP